MTPSDRKILRDLAKRVADIARLPLMEERKNLWKKHNALQRVRPLIHISPEGAWRELVAPTCEDHGLHGIELNLRRSLYGYEHFYDDTIVDSQWVVFKAFTNSGWGLEAHWKSSEGPGGAGTFDPVILTGADLKKLRRPEIGYDEAATLRNLKFAQDLFGDILDVQLRGMSFFGIHIMYNYTRLRGLEQVMMDMACEPEMLHDAMAFYEDAYKHMLRQYVEMNALGLNNDSVENMYGCAGWTDELPAPGFDPARVRPRDMWCFAEAQELALVSPEMHEEFVLAYERRIMAPFGLSAYGCCEDLSKKMEYVFKIPNIRRISISPFANVDVCAEKLKGKYIFSWKPHPAHLVGEFNPELVRNYIAHTLDVTEQNGCVLEMTLKDTHTCENHPERFTEWTRIARELINKRYGS